MRTESSSSPGALTGSTRFERTVTFVEETVPAVLAAVTLLCITAAVILRYVFDRPPLWVPEASVVLFVWQLFLGIAAAQRRRRHLGIEALVRFLPPRLRAVQEIIAELVVLVTLLVLTSFAWQLSATAAKQFALIPVDYAWVYRAVIAGLGCACVHLVVSICLTVRALVRNTYSVPIPSTAGIDGVDVE